MAINSRRKGAKNERVIAKLLQDWTGKKFAKTPASGGLNWRTTNVAGDVVCTTEGHYFPFCIEAKSYTKIDFSHLLTPGIKNIEILTFWAQAERDAKKANKIPILMMRYNGLPHGFYYLAITSFYYHQLPMLTRMNLRTTLTYWDREKDIKLYILKSTEFFTMPYKEIRKITKTLLKNAKR